MMRIRVYSSKISMFLLLAPAIVLVCVHIAAAEAALKIRLLPETQVSENTITLGRIAEIKAENDQVRQSVAAVELGASPSPGRTTWIHLGQVQACLQAQGIAMDNVSLTATGPVKVLRSYESLSAKKVCAAVKAFIHRSAPWDENQIKIRSVTYNQNHELPPGGLDLRVSAPKHTDWIGAIPFRVEAYVNGRLIRKMSVPAHVEVWSDVLVAAKPLGRKQPIRSTDIKVQRMNLSRVPQNAILRQDQIIGHRTTRAIAMNAILNTDHIEMPPVIRKGDVIQVVAETPSLKVATKGVAKEKGGVGELIRVINLRSKKEVYALIVDQTTVRVPF